MSLFIYFLLNCIGVTIVSVVWYRAGYRAGYRDGQKVKKEAIMGKKRKSAEAIVAQNGGCSGILCEGCVCKEITCTGSSTCLDYAKEWLEAHPKKSKLAKALEYNETEVLKGVESAKKDILEWGRQFETKVIKQNPPPVEFIPGRVYLAFDGTLVLCNSRQPDFPNTFSGQQIGEGDSRGDWNKIVFKEVKVVVSE